MKQVLRQRLQQKLTPQQILLMKLIQLPSQDLEMRLKREIEENPVLEDPSIASSTEDDGKTEETEAEELDSTELDLLSTDDDDYPGPPKQASEQESFFSLAETTSLQQDLVEQISTKISN